MDLGGSEPSQTERILLKIAGFDSLTVLYFCSPLVRMVLEGRVGLRGSNFVAMNRTN